jgi:hypothetical protein
LPIHGNLFFFFDFLSKINNYFHKKNNILNP